VAAEVGDAVYIVAADLLAATAAKCGWGEPKIVARFYGEQLEGAKFRHPFMDRISVGILGDHVTLEQGTGAVHTAPGHGQEDYVVGQQYGLEVYCPVDGGGRIFDPGTNAVVPAELIGKSVWEANPIVISILKEKGALMGQENISHSYPHCWRCHNATIFRATDQWFIGMDNNALRANALEAIKNVSWMPLWGEQRISNMVSSRPDWCISRQRVWGVPIVVFYCEKCRHPLTEKKILDSVVDQFAVHSADIWFEKTAAELVPLGTTCAKCGASEFTKENDILDVWFDSGSSHLATLNEEYGLRWPADFYMEGGDQYRGWFQSSLLIGVGLRGGAPYRGCATHGWALDGDGKAMHKSLGNAIEPADIIKDSGAEIIRLWSGSVEFTEDVRLSGTILTRLSEAYRKLRNTFRYMLGNLNDFDPAKDAVPGAELAEIDQWVLVKARDLVGHGRLAYDELAFHRVYRAVYDFATTDLSNVYFDVLKDRLYTSAAKSKARRSAQTALYRLAQALVRLLAPILSFTTEEVWGHLGNTGSVHTAYFPEPGELVEGFTEAHYARVANWDKLLPMRDEVLKSLEIARQEKVIGAPLEASVQLLVEDSLYSLAEEYARELPGLFIVSEVKLGRQTDAGVKAAIYRVGGTKCERCWKYTNDVGSDAGIPTVCAACAAAVRESMAA
jgi:isoleucyl-tRNA synthetase